METIIVSVLMSLLLVYVLYIWIRHGIQYSISISFYCLPQRHDWMFTVVLWSLAFPMLFIYNTSPPLRTLFPNSGVAELMVLAAFGLVLVGTAAHYVNKPGRRSITPNALKMHLIGSYTTVLSSQIGLWYHFGLWYLTAIFVISSLLLIIIKEKNKTWWIEIVAYLSSIAGIFFK